MGQKLSSWHSMSIIVALVLCWGEHMCFHPFLSLFFSIFLCSDTPDKGISDGLTKSGFPEKLHIWLEVAMQWFYYYSQNTSMAFTVKEPRWVTVSSGICFPPLKSGLEARWKQQWQLLGLSLCSLAALWRSWSVKKTHALSLFYNAALCFPFSIQTSTIF